MNECFNHPAPPKAGFRASVDNRTRLTRHRSGGAFNRSMNQREKCRARVWAFWIAGILMLLAGVFLLILGRNDPMYQGKSLSQHLMAFSADGRQVNSEHPYQLVGLYGPSDERSAAWDALLHFGDEALPTLVKLAGTKGANPVRQILDKIARKMPFSTLRYPTSSERRNEAVTAFICYGPRAASVAPLLVPLLEDPRTARTAIFALAFIEADDDQ